MNFGFSAEQQTLRHSAREFLQRECPTTLVRELQEPGSTGHSPELWRKMAAVGWLGLVFPEEYGGAGAGLLELAILYEQAGRALVPTTLYSTIAGALAILNAGAEAQKQAILPRVAAGELILTLALAERDVTLDTEFLRTRARAEGDHYVLEGTKMFVPNAHLADYLVVVARTGIGRRGEGVSAFLVEGNAAGLSCQAMHTFGKDRQSEVKLEGVRVPETSLLGEVGQAGPALAHTIEQLTALQSVEMVGGAQFMLDKTVEYLKQRVQFDRPIGSFQAVHHHAANMAMEVDAARFTAYQAVSRLSKGLPATREVAIGKAVAGEAYKRVSLMAHQLHGGIGFTAEYGLHLWSARAKATELSLGTYDYHLETVAQQMGL